MKITMIFELVGKSPGAPKGNKNAFKHGGYSAEAIEARRKIATLLRTMRTLVERSDAAKWEK
jgi:uncharacterized protein YjcR